MSARYIVDLDREDYFDVAEGLHWYCVDYHDGQWSDLYRIQCGLDFKPSPRASGPESETAQEVYAALESGDMSAEGLAEWLSAALSARS